MEGHVKLHRKSLDSRVFSDPVLWRLWCWCLMRANWKRGWYGGCEVRPGQFVTGRKAASEDLGVSGSAWYRGMQKLQEFGCVKIEANSQRTTITVVNWRKYQAQELASETKPPNPEQRAGNERTTSGQRADTIEEGKERKKEKKRERYASEEFLELWSRWLQHHQDVHGRTLTQMTDAQLLELYRLQSEDEAMRWLRYSLANSTGARIFDPDRYSKDKPDDQAEAESGWEGVFSDESA